jgi:hypothetical protein
MIKMVLAVITAKYDRAFNLHAVQKLRKEPMLGTNRGKKLFLPRFLMAQPGKSRVVKNQVLLIARYPAISRIRR